MAETALSRLKSLGIELPPVPAPAASYIPTVRTGNLLFISGQVSAIPGREICRQARRRHGPRQGQGSRAGLRDRPPRQHAGGARRPREGQVRVVKLTGFVNVTPDFNDPHQVINGCSDLLIEVLGERGRHARSAFGVANLPLGFAVEVEAIVEVT